MKIRRNKTKSWTPYQLFLISILLTLIFFFGLISVTYKNDLKTTKAMASETISFLKDSCQRYNNSALDSTTDSMQNILDKTIVLQNHISTSSLEDSTFLSQYASEQGLTGILILDENLQQVAAVTLSGTDAYSLWKKKILDYNQNPFSENPYKVLSDHTKIHKKTYDVAIVPRNDAKGIILCYKDSKKETTDSYSLSFKTLLTNNTFYKNPRIVITDNKNIITTNVAGLQSLNTVNDSSLTDTDNPDHWSSDDLIRLKFNRRTWYGLRKVYGNYYIYVFYSTNEIFSNMIPITACFIAFYAIACIIMLLIRQHYQQESNQQLQKQFRTIKAIAGLYSSTALVNLETQMTEPIHLSPQLEAVLKGNRNTDHMLQLIQDFVIAPEYQKEFAKFADLNTLADRLSGKTYLSCTYQDRHGTWYMAYLISERYDNDGNLTAALIASRNVNDYKSKEEAYKKELQKTAEDALLANTAKTTFLRRMSHDIRTPINGIRGMATIARRRVHHPDEVEDCLDKILSSSDYLLDLVNDVLQMTKLESGKVVLEEKAFDLKDIITETISFIKVQADEKKIQLLDKTIEVQHQNLIGSPLHIRQIIQNIITNAIKYTPSGGSISLNCKEVSETSDYAVYAFTCSDTGIGMSKEFQTRAFEPFVQEHNDARTTYSGTGLGLSIVKDLVERMGGKITLSSQLGVGTTFIITLPLKINPSVPVPLPEMFKTQESIQGIQILLVEDNALNLEIASSLLQEEGAVITEAENGKKALQLFEQSTPGQYQVILMDIMMPVMDGLTATRKIRALNRPDASSIPIFAMTANSFVEDIQQSTAAGMNEHFTKPLDIPALIKAIYHYTKEV